MPQRAWAATSWVVWKSRHTEYDMKFFFSQILQVFFFLAMSLEALPQELCSLVADYVRGYQAEGVLCPERVELGVAWGEQCYEDIGWYGHGGSCPQCGLRQEYFERGPNGMGFITVDFTPGHFTVTCSQWCSDAYEAEVLKSSP